MIVGVVNDSDDVFVVGDVCSGCNGTSEHGRGSLNVVVVQVLRSSGTYQKSTRVRFVLFKIQCTQCILPSLPSCYPSSVVYCTRFILPSLYPFSPDSLIQSYSVSNPLDVYTNIIHFIIQYPIHVCTGFQNLCIGCGCCRWKCMRWWMWKVETLVSTNEGGRKKRYISGGNEISQILNRIILAQTVYPNFVFPLCNSILKISDIPHNFWKIPGNV